MNEETAKQLVKQLKRLNFWVTTFGIILLVGLGIIGFILFQVVTFVKSTGDKLNSVGSSLDVKQQVCSGTGGFSDFIKKSTSACN